MWILRRGRDCVEPGRLWAVLPGANDADLLTHSRSNVVGFNARGARALPASGTTHSKPVKEMRQVWSLLAASAHPHSDVGRHRAPVMLAPPATLVHRLPLAHRPRNVPGSGMITQPKPAGRTGQPPPGPRPTHAFSLPEGCRRRAPSEPVTNRRSKQNAADDERGRPESIENNIPEPGWVPRWDSKAHQQWQVGDLEDCGG